MRVPVLQCDGHTRAEPCTRQFIGADGGTLAGLREAAYVAGWRPSPSRRGDYCPDHAAAGVEPIRPATNGRRVRVPVTTWSPDGRHRVTKY